MGGISPFLQMFFENASSSKKSFGPFWFRKSSQLGHWTLEYREFRSLFNKQRLLYVYEDLLRNIYPIYPEDFGLVTSTTQKR